MSLLRFSERGKQVISEPSPEECDAVRMHNWIERTRFDGEKTSIKTNLTETFAQLSNCSNVRKVEFAIPRVKLGQTTGLSNL